MFEAIGLVGRKCGMTRIFKENGDSLPVTAIQFQENRVTQLKSLKLDGYNAIQIGTENKKISRTNKAEAGHFAKANVEACRFLKEFRISDSSKFELGQEIKLDIFSEGQKVNVIGTSKGKGFAGTVKRHNFATQDATHGNSRSHRVPGSIGQNQDPGRVFKGKKMPGHMGNVKTTVQNLEVVKIDLENNVILVKGSVPGATGSRVIITPAAKKTNSA